MSIDSRAPEESLPGSSRQRFYGALLALGAAALLTRTLVLLSEGAVGFFVPWVSGLLFLEMGMDALALVVALRWWATGRPTAGSVALRWAVAVVGVHALRVAIFVLGRTGPWIDFDVRPEARADHGARWTWPDVYLAATLTVLAVAATWVIWRHRRQRPGWEGGRPTS
ncbi:MAG: hypothetical protein OEO23_01060 [Gemmatimonadota bacterium]|nr:hypothetical protein [Gemmatimonadota bacterium]